MTFHGSSYIYFSTPTLPHHVFLKAYTVRTRKTLAKKMGKERKGKTLPGGKKQSNLLFLQREMDQRRSIS